jgi:maleamate amidohydrolase
MARRNALRCGFGPLVVSDACADRAAAYHDSNLRDPDAKSADIIDVAEALARIAAG